MKEFEAGSDVGGVWNWNGYPTEMEGWVYAMNFAAGIENDWSYNKRYPSRVEVQSYLSQIAGMKCSVPNAGAAAEHLARSVRPAQIHRIQRNQ